MLRSLALFGLTLLLFASPVQAAADHVVPPPIASHASLLEADALSGMPGDRVYLRAVGLLDSTRVLGLQDSLKAGGDLLLAWSVANRSRQPVHGVFAQLLGPDGRPFADRTPLAGTVKPGQAMQDSSTVSLPAKLRTGSYTVEVTARDVHRRVMARSSFRINVLGAQRGRSAGSGLRLTSPLSAAPNPAGGATTLRFAVAEQTQASLVVYDALGREVARPVEGSVSGVVEAQLDAAALPAGVYVARLVTGAGTETVRLTVVR